MVVRVDLIQEREAPTREASEGFEMAVVGIVDVVVGGKRAKKGT